MRLEARDLRLGAAEVGVAAVAELPCTYRTAPFARLARVAPIRGITLRRRYGAVRAPFMRPPGVQFPLDDDAVV